MEMGKKFGRWTIISDIMDEHGKIYCLCDCGKFKEVLRKNIIRGRSKSCGCYNREITTGKVSVHRKEYGESDFNHLYLVYKNGAKKRNLSFSLSKEYFKHLTSSNCYYCGIEPKQTTGRKKYTQTYGEYLYNGIDRINNKLGYTELNCVSCCKICNYAKHKSNHKEFIEWINKLVDFQTRKSN